MAVVALILRVGLGALLVVAAALKLHDGSAATATTIAGYRLLPPGLVAPLAIALPYVELILGAYLAAGLQTRVVATLAALQFAAFAAAVASLVVRGIPADCGCFGSAIPTPPSWGHVALDVLLALAAAFVARAGAGRWSLDRVLGAGGPAAAGREVGLS